MLISFSAYERVWRGMSRVCDRGGFWCVFLFLLCLGSSLFSCSYPVLFFHLARLRPSLLSGYIRLTYICTRSCQLASLPLLVVQRSRHAATTKHAAILRKGRTTADSRFAVLGFVARHLAPACRSRHRLFDSPSDNFLIYSAS